MCSDLTDEQCATFTNPDTPADDVLDLLRCVALKYQPNTTLRVLMTGLTQSGKTSFVSRTRGGDVFGLPGDESSRTQGVDLSTVDVPIPDTSPPRKAQLVLFDFGGHFEYWPIRAQFLSQDCVVAVTFNMKTLLSGSTDGAFEEVMLWVEAVEGSLGGGSTVGVVLLGTHLDVVKKGWVAENPSLPESQFVDWVKVVMGNLYGRVKRRVTGSTSSPTRLMGWAALCLVGGLGLDSPLESLVCIPGTSPPSSTERSENPVDIVLQAALLAAPSALPRFFAAIPGKGAVELVRQWLFTPELSQDADLPETLLSRWRMSLQDLADLLLQLSKDNLWFNISSDADIPPVVAHLVSTGCALLYPPDAFTRSDALSWENVLVVTHPRYVGKLLACAMNHRYVGQWMCDAETDALLASTDPSIMSSADVKELRDEQAEMLRAGLVGDDLKEDEVLYVSHSILTRRFLRDVLLHPSRPRFRHLCRAMAWNDSFFFTPFESDPSTVWRLLQTVEYGVVITEGALTGESDTDRMFIPHLALLRHLTTPAPSAYAISSSAKLLHAAWSAGVESGDGGAAIPDKLGHRPIGSVLQRGWSVQHLPVDLFAKVVHEVLTSRDAVKEVVGPSLWLSTRDTIADRLENVVVWFHFDGEPLPAPTEAAGEDGAKRALRLMARMRGRGEVRVVGWYDADGEEDGLDTRASVRPLFRRVVGSIGKVLGRQEYVGLVESEYVPLTGENAKKKKVVTWKKMEAYTQQPTWSDTKFVVEVSHLRVGWCDLAPMTGE